jgi:hypothetical protein
MVWLPECSLQRINKRRSLYYFRPFFAVDRNKCLTATVQPGLRYSFGFTYIAPPFVARHTSNETYPLPFM